MILALGPKGMNGVSSLSGPNLGGGVTPLSSSNPSGSMCSLSSTRLEITNPCRVCAG